MRWIGPEVTGAFEVQVEAVAARGRAFHALSGRWGRPALLFLAGALVAGAVVTGIRLWGSEQPATAPPGALKETVGYLGAIEPLAKEGGKVVTQGMKPGIATLQGRLFSRRLLRGQTAVWARDIESVRARWGRQVPPAQLDPAHYLFMEALDGYVEAAQVLQRAVDAGPERRERLVAQAVRAGEAADEVWDEAAAVVQARLRVLGRQAVAWLPGG